MNKLKKIDEAWLKIDVDEKTLFDPTSILNSSEDDFHLKLTWLMTRIFFFSSKTNIQYTTIAISSAYFIRIVESKVPYAYSKSWFW